MFNKDISSFSNNIQNPNEQLKMFTNNSNNRVSKLY